MSYVSLINLNQVHAPHPWVGVVDLSTRKENMRLTKNYIKTIKRSFFEVFTKGEIYLFSSRVDDSKKGGRLSREITKYDEY